jgi:micrococcal nuclease
VLGPGRRLVLAAVLLLAPAPAAWSQEVSRPRSLPAAVVKVVSGDTIHVFVNGDVDRVRYIGVSAPDPGSSAPESGEPLGREALRFNHGLTNAKNVRLELDVQERDAEGRLLAYVWLGDVLVNAEMIGRGFARVVTGTPNVRHQETLLRREERARAAKLGIWKLGPAPPKSAPARPGIAPRTGWSCPPGHPIKGNFTTYTADRCIYYVPGSPAHVEGRTERCYASEDEARRDGCRRSQR